MAGTGADIFCGRNTADAVLRGLHLLLREEQPELEDHQPAHLIYIYSHTISQERTEEIRLRSEGWVNGLLFWVGVGHIEKYEVVGNSSL